MVTPSHFSGGLQGPWEAIAGMVRSNLFKRRNLAAICALSAFPPFINFQLINYKFLKF
ncbi:msr0584 [Mesorhizobium japonicum MAFF 303099]|uniref:Msr0584 protein n=1 Tax=Mesorhizobium japonicum (strain LMG 29417 / CECT 9101 / MAFF 303099) TaxID=266835 RepID=Q98MG9_RHILO|nr:msr0584 [Mesorhizobium japonicum MAFF 303099]